VKHRYHIFISVDKVFIHVPLYNFMVGGCCLARIRDVVCYGYYKSKDRPRAKARYRYIRKAYFFPKDFEEELTPFLSVDLAPCIVNGRIVLEPKRGQ